MSGNGLIVWLMGGTGVVLMYAAIKGATLASVLAGKPVSTAAGAAPAPAVSAGSFKAPFTSKNPFGTIVPPHSKPLPPVFGTVLP